MIEVCFDPLEMTPPFFILQCQVRLLVAGTTSAQLGDDW